MSKLRSLSTSFWSDPFIEDLTPNQKLLFIYLVTNEKTNMLGIYESSIKKMSFETGISTEEISKGLKEFERVEKVKYENNYIILVNYMKHQNYNPNMKKSAIDVYNSLPKELKDSDLNISKDNPLKGFESLLNHYGMVRKVEDEVEVKKEVKKEDEDVLKNIDTLLQNYKANKRLIEAVCSSQNIQQDLLFKRLDKFNEHLKNQNRFSETWSEYTRYFLNWNRKQKTTNKKHLNKNGVDMSMF